MEDKEKAELEKVFERCFIRDLTKFWVFVLLGKMIFLSHSFKTTPPHHQAAYLKTVFDDKKRYITLFNNYYNYYKTDTFRCYVV